MTPGTKRVLILVAALSVMATAATVAFLSRDVPATNAVWPGVPFQSEDEWIVSQTAVAVVDLAQFARTSAPAPLSSLGISRIGPSADGSGLSFRIGSRDVTIGLKTYVWDPDAYVALAKAEGVAGASVQAVDDAHVVEALLDLKVETLRLQNDAISVALQTDYRNPASHEAAALLLAAFALREFDHYFYDPRLVLCRAAAHLAVARALRSSTPPSEAGQLADIVLQVVEGRPAPALQQLEVFARAYPTPAVQSWTRALHRRATLDWRMPPSDDSPLVERLTYLQSLVRMRSASYGLQYVTSHSLERIPDWGWIALDTGFTVESGATFVDDTLEQTMAEALQVLGISGADATVSRVNDVLARVPGPSSIDRSAAGGIHVIDDGTWSTFYRRELEHAATSGSEFYRDLLGAPDKATGFEAAMDRLMGRQPLWPIVERLRVDAEQSAATEPDRDRIASAYKSAMSRVGPIFRDRPQTIPYVAWLYASTSPRGVQPIGVPQTSLWFRTIFPTGTAFEARRMNIQKIIPNDFVAHADAIHALSPWEPPITINWSLVKCRTGCSLAEEKANFALVADYDTDTMRRLAEKNPDAEADWKRLCEASVEDCGHLVDWYRARGRFPEAAAANQDLFDRRLDRIGASNDIEWLVRYYQKTGNGAQARRVAQAAASVGSGRGMAALAGVLEREGNPDSAAELYRRIFTRYDEGELLLAFLLRRADATGVAPTSAEYSKLLTRYFAGGLERVSTASLAGKPDRGLLVSSTGDFNRKYFRRGDIIVAIDGVRVSDHAQSQILYERSFDAPLRYTVWRGNEYLDIEGPFRTYYYGVETEEIPRPGSAAR